VQIRVNNTSRSRRHAFTLMEVLVVVAILVVLAGIGVAVFRYVDTAKEGAAKAGVVNLEKAVMAYSLDHQGNFPDSLAVLAQPSEGKKAYVEMKDLLDPWNREYTYDHSQQSPTGKPLIMSQGANPGQSKVIRNWD
jgi:general secretion pathway protein G